MSWLVGQHNMYWFIFYENMDKFEFGMSFDFLI